ncbi:MAG: 2-oxoacid:ferredoxin oxidoreductase subunit beta [Firmicutes bacterium]|nr:2-oxoacid:ferredoxin oxidoreductase subunit beta [Bacillota bacterium]
MPQIWCAGCGHGTILGAILRGVEKSEIDPSKLVIVSGIGCSSRAPGYVALDGLHTTHGRALPFATGIKVARPDLTVMVISGDGDLSAIGGNHFIHAARRNLDITVVCFNNSIYGMTSGQYSPLTPRDAMATTAPYGHIERPFDLCQLAIGAGATYVARGTAYHAGLVTNQVTRALKHKGFAFIDAISQCPTYYGRRNRMKTGVEMMKAQRDTAVNVKRAAKMPAEELAGKIIIGDIHVSQASEYTEEYQRVIDRAQGRT